MTSHEERFLEQVYKLADARRRVILCWGVLSLPNVTCSFTMCSFTMFQKGFTCSERCYRGDLMQMRIYHRVSVPFVSSNQLLQSVRRFWLEELHSKRWVRCTRSNYLHANVTRHFPGCTNLPGGLMRSRTKGTDD